MLPAVLQVQLPGLQQIGIELGGGAIVGGVIGFAAKKIAKIIAIIVGLELALFKFLETKGVLEVNWGAITGAAEEGGDAAAGGASWATSLIAAMPVSAGFAAGFYLGFRRG